MRRAPRRSVLRVLSILATLLWVGLAVFTVVAIYYVAAGGVWACLSEPLFMADYDKGRLKMVIGILVENQAIFDLMNVRAYGVVADTLGNVIGTNTTDFYYVGVGSELSFSLSFYLSISKLAANPSTSYLMTEKARLAINMTLSMIYAYIFPTKAMVTIKVDWGPPLLGLRARLMKGPSPSTTCVLVMFKNAAPFWFKGYLIAHLYSNWGLLAEEETYMLVHKGEEKAISIILPISPDDLPEHYKLVLEFKTNMFYFTWGYEHG